MKIDEVLRSQVLRFAIVGLVSNGILYVSYLALTEFGMGSKMAMTILYVAGVLQGFVFNKKWTFSHDGDVLKTFAAYISLYAFGYFVNLLILFVLVDMYGYKHQWVQGGAVIFLAGFFFVAQKIFIFKADKYTESRVS